MVAAAAAAVAERSEMFRSCLEKSSWTPVDSPDGGAPLLIGAAAAAADRSACHCCCIVSQGEGDDAVPCILKGGSGGLGPTGFDSTGFGSDVVPKVILLRVWDAKGFLANPTAWPAASLGGHWGIECLAACNGTQPIRREAADTIFEQKS